MTIHCCGKFTKFMCRTILLQRTNCARPTVCSGLTVHESLLNMLCVLSKKLDRHVGPLNAKFWESSWLRYLLLLLLTLASTVIKGFQ